VYNIQPSCYYYGVVVVLMTGTYSLQKVNEGFIDLMWALYGFCQVVEYLKNKSWGSSRWCTVYNQCIDLTGTTIVLMINAYGL